MLGHRKDRIPNAAFRAMSTVFSIMDAVYPMVKQINNFGIEPGFTVVDYGCGPGRYIQPASQLVGENGRVYAIDVHELAIEAVQKRIREHHLKNVIPMLSIESDYKIASHSVDLLYALDMFHMVSEKQILLDEFYRMLKPSGKLILEDGHSPRKITLLHVLENDKWQVIDETKRYIVCLPK